MLARVVGELLGAGNGFNPKQALTLASSLSFHGFLDHRGVENALELDDNDRLRFVYKELVAQHYVVTAWADTARDVERCTRPTFYLFAPLHAHVAEHPLGW